MVVDAEGPSGDLGIAWDPSQVGTKFHPINPFVLTNFFHIRHKSTLLSF